MVAHQRVGRNSLYISIPENFVFLREFSLATKRREKSQESSCLFVPFCGWIPSVPASPRLRLFLLFAREVHAPSPLPKESPSMDYNSYKCILDGLWNMNHTSVDEYD